MPAEDRINTTVRIVLPHLETGSTGYSEKKARPEILNTILKKLKTEHPLSREKEKRLSGIRGVSKKRRELRRINRIP